MPGYATEMALNRICWSQLKWETYKREMPARSFRAGFMQSNNLSYCSQAQTDNYFFVLADQNRLLINHPEHFSQVFRQFFGKPPSVSLKNTFIKAAPNSFNKKDAGSDKLRYRHLQMRY